LLKAVNKGGRVVDFPGLKGQEKEKWLAAYLKDASKVPERGVITYISLMSGEGLLNVKSEADKLILYTEDKTAITMEDAHSVVSHSALAGVFELSDKMAEKKGAAAVTAFRQLWLQGEAPQKLLAMLGTQYRNTLAVKDMLERGYTQREIAARMAINPFVVQKCAAQARLYSNRQLSKALELLLNADIAQKKGEGEMKELMEVAILRICAM
jgi:DNA polymerase-3 subunit delta